MDMISPEVFATLHDDMTWDELIDAREELMDEILIYEQFPDKIPSLPGLDRLTLIDSDPDVIYQMNLLYLAELLKLTAKAFAKENYLDPDEWR